MDKDDPKLKDIRSEASVAKRLIYKRLEAMQGDSEWNLVQQIAQDIEAHATACNEKRPNLDDMLKLIPTEIKLKYPEGIEEFNELRDLLLEAVPSRPTMHKWRNKKGWDDAVWARIRGSGLFTADKRSQVINTLLNQAKDGNVTAAKIWLTLSGDYQEKGDTKNDVVEQFREINNILHGKK